KARGGHAHPRATEIVVTAVGLAPIARIGTTQRLEQRRIAFRIEKIMLAHIDAMTDQGRHREQEGKPIPDAESIGQPGETSEQSLAQRNSHVSLPLDVALHHHLVAAVLPCGRRSNDAFAFWNLYCR